MNISLDTLLSTSTEFIDEATGSVCTPINLSTTFEQLEPGVNKGFEYIRSQNPTRKALERLVAKLENGKYALSFCSGSASTTTICHLLDTGDHIVSIDDIYGGTSRYFNMLLKRTNGIKSSFCNIDKDLIGLKKAVKPNTKMIWLESPTNPMLKVIDIQKIAKFCKEKKIMCVMDNTFATFYLQKPLDLGVDIVVNSATKYINGHSDVLMGLLATNNENIAKRLYFLQNALGTVPSPFDCYLVIRGLKTLHLRMQRHCENAFKIAKFLSRHAKVEKTFYPGLETNTGHKIAKKQMKGYGGIVSLYVQGDKSNAIKFMKKLKLFILAESLGAVESLVSHPASMTHAAIEAEERIKLGISDNLVRLSVGVENADELIEDLDQALNSV